MQVIQIGAGSYDLAELCKSAPADGSSSSVGRQISRNNVRGQPRYQRAKISSAPQVGSLIDDLWWVALEVGITACSRQDKPGKGGSYVSSGNHSMESSGFDSHPEKVNHRPEASLACEC